MYKLFIIVDKPLTEVIVCLPSVSTGSSPSKSQDFLMLIFKVYKLSPMARLVHNNYVSKNFPIFENISYC